MSIQYNIDWGATLALLGILIAIGLFLIIFNSKLNWEKFLKKYEKGSKWKQFKHKLFLRYRNNIHNSFFLLGVALVFIVTQPAMDQQSTPVAYISAVLFMFISIFQIVHMKEFKLKEIDSLTQKDLGDEFEILWKAYIKLKDSEKSGYIMIKLKEIADEKLKILPILRKKEH